MENGEEGPVGATPAAELPDADTVQDVMKTRDWIDGQNYELSVDLKAEQLELLETDDVEELQERIASLQNDLLKVSADQSVKELILKRMLYDQTLSDKMFSTALPSSISNTEDTDTEQENGPCGRRVFEPLLQERSRLISAILKKEDVQELQKELDAVRKKNFELKKSNRRLMDVLAQHRKNLEKMSEDVKNNAACRGMKEELESAVSRVQIAKCTLQAVVVGSGVNWAEDPALLDTVLLCGDSMRL